MTLLKNNSKIKASFAGQLAQAPWLTLRQPERGYRYNIDSYLLARFADFSPEEVVADLGAGVGILSFLALSVFKVEKVIAVELQEELADFFLRNAEDLGFEEGRCELHRRDWREVRDFSPRFACDVVVSNPPYRKLQTGKISSPGTKVIAKHEVHGDMRSLIQAAKYLLKHRGRFCVMYPALRFEELVSTLKEEGLKIQRLQMVHPYVGREATHVLVEAVLAPTRELKVLPPLVVYRDPDHYTDEIAAWVGEKLTAPRDLC